MLQHPQGFIVYYYHLLIIQCFNHGGDSILCPKTVEYAPTILFRVFVYPQDKGGLPRLHRHVAQSRDVQDLGARVAAHGFQILEHVFRKAHRPLFVHPRNTLRHHGRLDRCRL